MALFVVGPAGNGLLVAVPASAGTPTPIDPNDLIPGESPSPSPTPSSSGQADEKKDKEQTPGASKAKGATSRGRAGRAEKKDRGAMFRAGKRTKRKSARAKKSAFEYPSVSYSSSRLVATALELRALGLGPKALGRAHAPFPVAGQSSWADTWGAPRFGPGERIRKHRGQDLICDEGTPILAVEAGRIEFDNTSLGGMVARLHTADGRYFYYAHLSGWNSEDFTSGDVVRPGDEIGDCGNSGNAHGTSPHLHLGWYDAAGKDPRNPHGILVEKLRAAEREAAQMLDRVRRRYARDAAEFRARRLFGQGFVPFLSRLEGCEFAQSRRMLAARTVLGFITLTPYQRREQAS